MLHKFVFHRFSFFCFHLFLLEIFYLLLLIPVFAFEVHTFFKGFFFVFFSSETVMPCDYVQFCLSIQSSCIICSNHFYKIIVVKRFGQRIFSNNPQAPINSEASFTPNMDHLSIFLNLTSSPLLKAWTNLPFPPVKTYFTLSHRHSCHTANRTLPPP